jgi:hypothetical protein
MKSSETDLSSALKELVDRDVLGAGSPASEIAIKVIATGIGSLTRPQRKLYDAVVVPALRDPKVPSQPAASIPIDKLNASNDD